MFIRLKNYYSDVIPERLKKILSEYKYAFNPSFVAYNRKKYLAIRLYDGKLNSIISLLFVWGDDERIQTINLSEHFNNREGISKVSDPKLFVMNDALWGVFNTGYTESNNSIVLFKLKGENINKYYFCDYAERSYVEKNWAFYSVNNELFALYSISPMIVLSAKKFKGNRIIFEQYCVNENTQYSNYSIGSPMVNVDGRLLFVAHKKIYCLGKRLYLGRPFTFTHIVEPELKARKVFLMHSIMALFGCVKKFNKNLISCTYFSGISYTGSEIQLSYGINDVKWGLVTVMPDDLWR